MNDTLVSNSHIKYTIAQHLLEKTRHKTDFDFFKFYEKYNKLSELLIKETAEMKFYINNIKKR